MPNLFDAPIPGQSLTLPRGASKLETPPKYTTTEDALNFLWNSFNTKRHLSKLVLLMKNGVTAESIARTTVYAGLIENLWTVDLALLIIPTVMYQIAAVGKAAGVKNLKVKNPDYEHEDFLSTFLPTLGKEETPATENAAAVIFKGLEG